MSLFKNIKNFLSGCFNRLTSINCRILSVKVDTYMYPTRTSRPLLQKCMQEIEDKLLRSGMNVRVPGPDIKAEICLNLSEKWLRLSYLRFYKDIRYDDLDPIPLTPLDRLTNRSELATYLTEQMGKRGISFEDKESAHEALSLLSKVWLYEMNNPKAKQLMPDPVHPSYLKQ